MARKTEKAIERDVFRIVRRNLTGVVAGEIYRKGMRPKDSKKEDVIVSFSAGTEGQFQSGEVYINIYIPFEPICGNSNMVPNISRIDELEEIMLNIIDDDFANDKEYLFGMRFTPKSYNEEEIEQSVLSTLLTYKRLT